MGDEAKATEVCPVCGKVPKEDMSGCERCDKLICDDCALYAHGTIFCSQACADEYGMEWLGQEDRT